MSDPTFDDPAMEDPLMGEILDFLRSYAAYAGWVEERGTRPPHCKNRSEELEDLFDRLRYGGYRIVPTRADADARDVGEDAR